MFHVIASQYRQLLKFSSVRDVADKMREDGYSLDMALETLVKVK